MPQPVAARYRVDGLDYRADLLTVELPVRLTLAQALRKEPAAGGQLDGGRTCIGALHAHGVQHADLNAHNLLLGDDEDVYVLDFDRGRIRARGAWEQRVLARLRRSLAKVTADLPPRPIRRTQWRALLAGAAE